MDRELPPLVNVEEDGSRLEVRERAFLRPSPADTSVNVVGVEAPNGADLVTGHHLGHLFPHEAERVPYLLEALLSS